MDSGSSDLFIDMGFVEKHHLAAYTIPAIRLRLIDSTCNSIITQAIKLHIHFSSSEKQHMNFYITPLDSSCTLVLGYCWLNQYNPSIDWVHTCIMFHTNTPNEPPPVQLPKNPIMAKPKPAPLKVSPADRTKPRATLRVTLINAKAFRRESSEHDAGFPVFLSSGCDSRSHRLIGEHVSGYRQLKQGTGRIP